ncbi:MAG: fibrobacter succinogenes major paralogous domain-containing protein [Dysgonamonadaceae bacterium]|jgi:uncharacterized protein (TIGR02145 family)|nr:fibrobacter succinogenes major paralogous domain-containing protein [Dysgonamonadaceae bacterium]
MKTTALTGKQPFVTINGLRWDRENLSIDGKEYFTHEEAIKAAASVGKRMPTQDEWEALLAPGSTWDAEKNGRWFGADHELKNDSKESIFLPAAGYRSHSNGSLNSRDCYGYYRSACKYSVPLAYNMYFSSSGAIVGNTYRRHGFSVRCVAEKATKTKRKKIDRFDISVRTSIIAFSAIAAIATLEAIFYRAYEHLYYALICLVMIAANTYQYLKNN